MSKRLPKMPKKRKAASQHSRPKTIFGQDREHFESKINLLTEDKAIVDSYRVTTLLGPKCPFLEVVNAWTKSDTPKGIVDSLAAVKEDHASIKKQINEAGKRGNVPDNSPLDVKSRQVMARAVVVLAEMAQHKKAERMVTFVQILLEYIFSIRVSVENAFRLANDIFELSRANMDLGSNATADEKKSHVYKAVLRELIGPLDFKDEKEAWVDAYFTLQEQKKKVKGWKLEEPMTGLVNKLLSYEWWTPRLVDTKAGYTFSITQEADLWKDGGPLDDGQDGEGTGDEANAGEETVDEASAGEGDDVNKGFGSVQQGTQYGIAPSRKALTYFMQDLIKKHPHNNKMILEEWRKAFDGDPLDELQHLQYSEEQALTGCLWSLDDFEVFVLLGQGAFGTVVAGVQTKFVWAQAEEQAEAPLEQINAALKLRFVNGADLVAATNDIFAAGQVRHENVLQVYGYFGVPNKMSEKPPFCIAIITPLCMESLEDMLSEQEFFKKLGESNKREQFHIVFDVMWQLFQGVKAFNNAGFLHREVKPKNVLKGEDGHWKISGDFGSAREKPGISEQLTSGVGTPIYWPPESTTKPALGHDLYSLGVTIYELMTEKLKVRQQYYEYETIAKEFGVQKLPGGPAFANLIARMLSDHRQDRLSLAEVGVELKKVKEMLRKQIS